MKYSQEHLKTMVYVEFGGQTECIMGNWKIENTKKWHQADNPEKGINTFEVRINTTQNATGYGLFLGEWHTFNPYNTS